MPNMFLKNSVKKIKLFVHMHQTFKTKQTMAQQTNFVKYSIMQIKILNN